jgi:hypothetical protein
MERIPVACGAGATETCIEERVLLNSSCAVRILSCGFPTKDGAVGLPLGLEPVAPRLALRDRIPTGRKDVVEKLFVDSRATWRRG